MPFSGDENGVPALPTADVEPVVGVDLVVDDEVGDAPVAVEAVVAIRDRAGEWMHAFDLDSGRHVEPKDEKRIDAEQALVALGFSDKEAEARVTKALERDANVDVESLVKAALRG